MNVPVALGLSVATPEGRPSWWRQASAYSLLQPPELKLLGPGAALGTATSNLLTYRQTSLRPPEKLG